VEYQYWPPEGADDESWSEAFLPLLALVRELDARRRKEAEKGMDPGDCVYSDDNDKTIFGEGPGNRCRVDVIASGADAERWTQQNLFGEKFRGENAFLRHWKILNKLPRRPSDERHGFSPYDFLSDERCAEASNGEDDDAKAWALLKEHWGEDFVATVRSWVKTDADLDTFRQLKVACRDDLGAVGRALARL